MKLKNAKETLTDIVTHDSPYDDRDKVGGAIRLDVKDFTHMGEGAPWFAHVQIEYAPRKKILDNESTAEYMDTWRSIEGIPESVIQIVCKDLANAVDPMVLSVQASYRNRNGVQTNVQARFVHPEANQQGPRIMAPGNG